jgi:hypothetical protein
VRHVEGFLSRAPPRDAVEPMVTYLTGKERPHFPLRKYLRREMRNYAQWLVEDLSGVERKLATMYGNQLVTPAIDLLHALPADEKRAQLVVWLEGYEKNIQRLALALEKPYAEGVKEIHEMDR